MRNRPPWAIALASCPSMSVGTTALVTIKPALASGPFLTTAVTFVTPKQPFALPSGLQDFVGRTAGPGPRVMEQLVPGVCADKI